jgi:uncharacterized repeat protein (TIGR03833 family)
VLLLGSLAERASQWLERAGDLRKITLDHAVRPATSPSDESAPAATRSTASALLGTRRSDVQPGQRVAIVMKADQATVARTEGIVRDRLTNSDTHPRGIKARLETGEVGRVQITLHGPH